MECYNKKYYYVSVDSLNTNYHQVEYIAIYQSKKLFGEDAGVLYYGEVLKYIIETILNCFILF